MSAWQESPADPRSAAAAMPGSCPGAATGPDWPPGAADKGEGGLGLAAGAALHRALESWDLAAEPGAEMERQRRLLPAYLGAVARDPARAAPALARAERLLARFAAGGLLARFRALGPRVLARELAVLLPPGDGEAGAAAVVSPRLATPHPGAPS